MAKQDISEEYLKSKECEELMNTELTEYSDRFHLADHPKHRNYLFRHSHMIHIGSWKWMCNWQNRELLFKLVFSDKKGIDFGGARCQIGGNAEVVDIIGDYPNIDDIHDYSLDYIYASQVLEHVLRLDQTLKKLYRKLKIGGIIYVAVPNYTLKRLRAGNWHEHLWTFTIEDNEFTRIDKKLERVGFKIIRAEYAWDDCLVLVGWK